MASYLNSTIVQGQFQQSLNRARIQLDEDTPMLQAAVEEVVSRRCNYDTNRINVALFGAATMRAIQLHAEGLMVELP